VPGLLITPRRHALTTQPPQMYFRGGLDWAVTRNAIRRDADLGSTSVQRVKQVAKSPQPAT